MANYNAETNWPSANMQTAIRETMGVGLCKAVMTWDFCEALAQPVYDYITTLLNNEGPSTYLLNGDGEELTIGVAAWDENCDDILASKQVPFSEILQKWFEEDDGEFERVIIAAEKSIAIARKALEQMREVQADGNQGA